MFIEIADVDKVVAFKNQRLQIVLGCNDDIVFYEMSTLVRT